MINKITSLFKNWSKLEICIALISPIIILILGLIFKSTILIISTAILGVLCAFFTAKGLIISQFLGLIVVVLYSLLSFYNHFYGEMLIYIFIMAPLYIWGIVSWITHKNKKTKTVKINTIKRKEWIVVALGALGILIGFYFVLKSINTNLLVLSTLSIVDNIFAVYLVARRSKYNFICYIFEDVLLLILWGILVLDGNLMLIAFLLNPIINLINDAYGIFHWNSLQNTQNNL